MINKSYVLVVNLKARQAEKAVDEIEKQFKTKKAKLKVIRVEEPSRIKEYFQKAIDLKPDVIVLGGGDGTLISGIEYLSYKGYKNPIGLLPLGTANYLARNLSISLQLPENIETLLKGNSREIPIGVANHKFFALTFIVGITQKVSNEVSTSLKRRFGQLAYIMELARQTKNHDPFKYKIESDSLKKTLTGTTHQLIVYNSDLNLQLKLVPDHDIAANSLKVVISKAGKSKLTLYFSFLIHIITFGRVRPYMHVFKTQSLKVSTEPKLPADFDGETFGRSPYEVSLYNRKVKIIC